jgi:hypothetical protein
MPTKLYGLYIRYADTDGQCAVSMCIIYSGMLGMLVDYGLDGIWKEAVVA